MGIWAHSSRDAVPCALTALQLGGNLWLAATFEERTLPELLVLAPAFVFLFWYNPIIAIHNFLHTPWFRSGALNRAYAALNSINLGLPQILYRHHHLNHHRYENDRRGPDGRTRDHSSTFAFGRGGRHEGAVAYSALGLFRRGTNEAWREALRKGEGRQLALEFVTALAGLALLGLLSWRFLVFFYLPVFYAGWFLAHLENYYEHYGAAPERRAANSVSYYGRLYNRLFCNEGYHQEHHLRPQAHWTRRPAVARELAGELAVPGRTISRWPPLLGFLDRR